jgi:hypothetical protein
MPSDLSAGGSAVIFELEDPRGDDHGDGKFVYPLRTDFENGDLDLVKVRVLEKADGALFELEFAEPIKVPQRGAIDDLGTDLTQIARHGFYTFNVDIYIDEDRIPLSGSTIMLPGRKAQVHPDHAWEQAICLTPRPMVARNSLRRLVEKALRARDYTVTPEGIEYAADSIETTLPADVDRTVCFPSKIRVRKRKISFEVPNTFLNDTIKPTWSYVIVVTGADLFQSLEVGAKIGLSQSVSDNLMVLPVSPGTWEDRFGGGRSNEPLQPPVVDLVVPPGQKQEWLLSSFNSRANKPAVLPGVVPVEQEQPK